MGECNICFEEKKLYDICKTCCKKVCQDCLISMIDEKEIYYTERDIKYNLKCPYCRSNNSNFMRKQEIVIIFKKMNEVKSERIKKLELQNEITQLQLQAFKVITDTILKKMGEIMNGITRRILNDTTIYTSINNISEYINTYKNTIQNILLTYSNINN